RAPPEQAETSATSSQRKGLGTSFVIGAPPGFAGCRSRQCYIVVTKSATQPVPRRGVASRHGRGVGTWGAGPAARARRVRRRYARPRLDRRHGRVRVVGR